MRTKIRSYLLIQFILVVGVVVSGKAHPFLWLLMAGIMLLIGWLFIVRPLLKMEQSLKGCSEVQNPLEALEKIDGELPYIKEIKEVTEKCLEEKTRKNSAEIFDNQAQLTALQSQINPHFLYNTLESVRGQALIDGNIEIAKMMEALSSFFRYSISRKGSLVALREELANIQNYMMIQRYRFNNRFSLEIYIDEEDEEAYDYKIPKLIIQPVVENAIFHGLEESLEGGKVVIEIIVTEKHLIITVSDNGKGMEQELLERLNDNIHTGYKRKEAQEKTVSRNTGIGLPNIHRRIQLLFGEEYGVCVYSTLNQGTDVEITIPISRKRCE